SNVASTSANPGITCTACHDQHGGPADALLGVFDAASGNSFINGRRILASDNVVCFACHNAAPTTPASLSASGWPDSYYGWPGESVYATGYNATTRYGSMHGTSAAVPSYQYPGTTYAKGDCKNCHDMHGNANLYDIVRGGTTATPNFSPKSAGVCFACHDSDGPASSDIKQYWGTYAGGTQTTTTATRYGHQTKCTTSTVLPAGSAVPCYACHNPHGTAGSAFGLLIVTRANNTTVVLGDAADEITITAPGSSSAPAIRNFCFACHTASDTGNGYSGGTTLTTVVAADMVQGISRTSGRLVGGVGPVLRLPVVNGHRQNDTDSCYKCHGGSYPGSNVHNPTGGLSAGGTPCYGCHTAYQSPMEDGLGSATGATRANFVHHVMGNATSDGDTVTPGGTGAYPTSTTDVFCLSCHTDHNYFNGSTAASPAANLRQNIGSTNGALATNTDFMPSGSYGICVSCHSTGALAKQGMGSDQLNVGAANTPDIDGAPYAASAHDYESSSTLGVSKFRANCSKCHTDDAAKDFQTGTYTFGTHYDNMAGLLTALGVVTSPPKDEACRKCHDASGDVYGTAMSAAAKAVDATFTSSVSKHPMSKVTCANCHNVHEASAADAVFDADNTYNSAGYSLTNTGSVNTFCLKCHDGTLPAQTVNGTTYIPWTVTANATANVGAFYTTDGHGYAAPGTPISNQVTTLYGAVASDTPVTWNNEANALGSTAGNYATSNQMPFDMWQTFTFPSGITNIDGATITVRSQANPDGWNQITTDGYSTPSTYYPQADHSIVPAANTSGTAPFWDDVDDPYNTPDDRTAGSYFTFINDGTATSQAMFFLTTSPTIPAQATSISVEVVYRAQDVTTGVNWVAGLLNCGGTTYTPSPARRWDPPAAWTTTRTVWANNPRTAAAWTVAQINTGGSDANGLRAFGVACSDANPDISVTQVYLLVKYVIQNDDDWNIQYSTNSGGSWTDITAATSTSETVDTDHTLSLNGILTAANYTGFAVRVRGLQVGAVDSPRGTLDWDYSALQIQYDGNLPGTVRASCRSCHEQHGSTLPKLLNNSIDATNVPANDMRVCFACHDANGPGSNIASYYPPTGYRTAPATHLRPR
ncbi:MAG: hypothetical protein FDZ70_08240, partial [Actinobacteria bacterium]